MSLRRSVAAFLVLALLVEMPGTASAQEAGAPAEDVPAAAPLVLTSFMPVLQPIGARLAFLEAQPRSSLPFFAKAPEDIRLSHGAKTAIIVTAIIVGALLIVGAIAISRPGHL